LSAPPRRAQVAGRGAIFVVAAWLLRLCAGARWLRRLVRLLFSQSGNHCAGPTCAQYIGPGRWVYVCRI